MQIIVFLCAWRSVSVERSVQAEVVGKFCGYDASDGWEMGKRRSFLVNWGNAEAGDRGNRRAVECNEGFARLFGWANLVEGVAARDYLGFWS